MLTGLIARAVRHDRLPEGWRVEFAGDGSDVLPTIMAVMEAERQCCRFLRFQLTVEPDGGPIRLELTGPAGTGEFLAALLAG